MNITVYREVGRLTERCVYGNNHDVIYVEVKMITKTGETREHDNGYETCETGLFLDAQGRVYHQHVTIDYCNNVSYVRDDNDGGGRYTPRLTTRTAYRDLTGKGIGTVPDGPAWVDNRNRRG